jgi:predicted nucleotidyltransferase
MNPMASIKDILYHRNPMLILSYLSRRSSSENYASAIATELRLAMGSVHRILRDFEAWGLVRSRRVGKTVLFEMDKMSPMVKSFRVFDNLLELDPLFVQIKPISRRGILFGSCSRGEDSDQSDVDLLVEVDEDLKRDVLQRIADFPISREIRPILLNTVEFMEMEKSDKVFYTEVMKGIEVWENYGGSD